MRLAGTVEWTTTTTTTTTTRRHEEEKAFFFCGRRRRQRRRRRRPRTTFWNDRTQTVIGDFAIIIIPLCFRRRGERRRGGGAQGGGAQGWNTKKRSPPFLGRRPRGRAEGIQRERDAEFGGGFVNEL